jgi:tripartite-type tricarboxylate transporter receptor subunit TctC
MLAEAPTVSVVRANSPFATMPALINAARQRPVRFGSSGVGSANISRARCWPRATGASQLEHIPYRGTAPALQDLLAGQIDMLNAPITTLIGQVRDGSLRLLATSSEVGIGAFPDTPTLAELGAPQATHTQWIGLSGPRSLPAPIVGPSFRSARANRALGDCAGKACGICLRAAQPGAIWCSVHTLCCLLPRSLGRNGDG